MLYKLFLRLIGKGTGTYRINRVFNAFDAQVAELDKGINESNVKKEAKKKKIGKLEQEINGLSIAVDDATNLKATIQNFTKRMDPITQEQEVEGTVGELIDSAVENIKEKIDEFVD